MITQKEIQDVVMPVFIFVEDTEINEITYGIYSLDCEENYTNVKGIKLYIPVDENGEILNKEEGYDYIYGQFEDGELEPIEDFEGLINFMNDCQESYIQWSQECLTFFQESNYNLKKLKRYKNNPNLFWKERGLSN